MTSAMQQPLSDPAVIAARERGLARLKALFGGEQTGEASWLNGISCYTEDDGPEWESWLERSLSFLSEAAGQSLDERVFRPLCINYNPHGVHFVDQLLGADVFQLEDGSWQAHPLATPVGQLRAPELEELASWQQMQAFARAFLARDVPGVIFGLPTIASVLNIAVNLYGQEILAALYEQPEAARRDLDTINAVLRQLHAWYREQIPPAQLQCIIPDGRCQPEGFGQLCGCTTQLVSRQTYHQFIAPLDDALLRDYPQGGMIHLCGKHTQHIPTWRELDSFRAFQLNDRAAEDLETYFQGLREDQILYVNPCAGMPVERILEITAGRRVVIVGLPPE